MTIHHLEDAADAVDRLLKQFNTLKLPDKIDVAARARAIAKNLEQIDTEAKAEIKKKRKGEISWLVLGRLFQAKGIVVSSERLDTKRLKEEYPDIYQKCLATSESERISFEVR